jgi:hypothetical protein
MRPSRQKIHCHPFNPPTPSILTIPYANIPLNAPELVVDLSPTHHQHSETPKKKKD